MILTTIEYANCHQNFFVDYKWSKVSTNILVYDNLETKFENMAIVWPGFNVLWFASKYSPQNGSKLAIFMDF